MERNVGEVDHSDVQTALAHYLRTHYKKRVWAGVAARVQVKKTRFRIPDVTVMLGLEALRANYPQAASDRYRGAFAGRSCGRLEEKINDYLAFGIPCVWVINPETRRAYIHTPKGSHEAKDGMLARRSAGLEVPLAKIFG